MIKDIVVGTKIYARIIHPGYTPKGVSFLTPADNPLQVGVFLHPSGYEIKPHTHKESLKIINVIQEVLHIEYGCVEVCFYENDGLIVAKEMLYEGDTIILLSGGHGFRIVKDAKIIEIKQGPYQGNEMDKVYFS
ncbi:hypothetical protein [Pelotomaculum propionicicum]|uniref:Uncharacterized protein n=1 Tax=Pelotomaculum propionicicum TaxID=258475 RepID=A0A4Y7RQP4_9FIRM|nr:hypothetical protein [Pelotomaculum propionicicum]TEB11060.1 hypothetical protein Pmgp_01932 [Pelotomaculum propionicicum]